MQKKARYNDNFNNINLNEDESLILEISDASNAEEILSLMEAFPTLATSANLYFPTISNSLARQGATMQSLGILMESAAPDSSLTTIERARQAIGFGAEAPESTSPDMMRKGDVLTLRKAQAIAASSLPSTPLPGSAIDLRAGLVWPIRNQGQRGTCVSFGSAAALELKLGKATGTMPDLAEQFLHWAIKTKTADPKKAEDGTWSRFAGDALRTEGICLEQHWGYNPNPIPGNIPQGSPGNPSAVAVADAASRKVTGNHSAGNPAGGNAAAVLAKLRSGKAVCVSLPVFKDPAMPRNTNNWTTSVGFLYGRVLDPVPTSVVAGGHATCVVGFVPNPKEQMGGYFVIRNSWHVSWGRSLPAAGYAAPEPGYGQVSASYVDRYLWEMFSF